MNDHDKSQDTAQQNEYGRELAALLSLLETVDRQITPEHVAQRFRELIDDIGDDGPCAEVALIDRLVAMRDSKHPVDPDLMCTPAEWDAFRQWARRGEFDERFGVAIESSLEGSSLEGACAPSAPAPSTGSPTFLLNAAAREADKAKADARRCAEEMQDLAPERAARIEAKARERAARIEAKARERAARIEAKAREKAERILNEARRAATGVEATARAEDLGCAWQVRGTTEEQGRQLESRPTTAVEHQRQELAPEDPDLLWVGTDLGELHMAQIKSASLRQNYDTCVAIALRYLREASAPCANLSVAFEGATDREWSYRALSRIVHSRADQSPTLLQWAAHGAATPARDSGYRLVFARNLMESLTVQEVQAACDANARLRLLVLGVCQSAVGEGRPGTVLAWPPARRPSRERTAREVMVPVGSVTALTPDTTVHEALEQILLSGIQALPVHDGAEVARVVTLADLARRIYGSRGVPSIERIETLIRPAAAVAMDASGPAVRNAMAHGGTGMVIVTGPDGETAGYITAESLLAGEPSTAPASHGPARFQVPLLVPPSVSLVKA